MRAKPAVASPWILSPGWDAALFIGAPALAIATLLPLRAFWSSQQLSVFLLAFFTFGHHFPGFLRAYGDRDLFARYRRRFLLAPPLLFTAALWFDARNLHGLLILLSAWDIWHVLMQNYGFMRIYDAKAGQTASLTAWLDRAVSILWYVTLIAWSPHYVHDLARRAYSSGLPLVSAAVFDGARLSLTVLTGAASLVYLGYHVYLFRKGRPASVRKLALLAILLAATFFLYVYIEDFLAGFAVWSAFHCLQYYGIVWVFNRNRVAKSKVEGLLRFLFRPSTALVLLYAGLILAYGGVNYLVSFVADENLRRVLIAFTFTSAALHYYYDGFIWKVREPETRRHLDIAVGPAPPAWKRSALQPAYLAGIVVLLAGLELWMPNPDLAMRQSLAALAPAAGEAHFNLGDALWKEGRLDEAIEAHREALRRLPDSAEAHNNLGAVLHQKGLVEEAIQHYRRALEIRGEGKSGSQKSFGSLILPATLGQSDSFATHSNLADALAIVGRRDESLQHYRQALALRPDSAKVLTNLGATLSALGRYQEAAAELQRALASNPDYAAAHINLGAIMVYRGDPSRARFHFEQAMRSGDGRARQAAERALAELQ